MIPLRDSRRSGTVPVVNIILIIINSLVWLYEVSRGTQFEAFILQHGLIPLHLVQFYRFPGGFWENAGNRPLWRTSVWARPAGKN